LVVDVKKKACDWLQNRSIVQATRADANILSFQVKYDVSSEKFL